MPHDGTWGANVWAEQYKIVFAKSVTDQDGSQEITNTTKVSTVVSEGINYVSGFTKSNSRAYYKGLKGVKLASKSGEGTFEFNIADSYQKNIKKIIVVSAQYKDINSTLSLYSGSTLLKSGITPAKGYTHVFTEPTTVSSLKFVTTGKQAYISEIILETEEANNPTLVASESALDFGSVENNTSKDLTFKLSGKKLTADAALSVDGEYFTVTPTSVAQTDGTIAETYVTVSYKPTVVGSHTATLTISSTGATDKTITLTGTSANAYNVAWSVNGKAYSEGTPTTKVVDGEKVTVLPTTPKDINGKVFVGWTATSISGESASKPTDLFATVENAPEVSANTTYYAVFANKVGSEYWKKVTVANVNSEGEGEYALLTPDGHAFNGEIEEGHGQATTDAFTFVSDKAENAPEGTCVLTLTKVGTNGYKMHNAEYGYLYAKDDRAGNLAWNTTEDSYWSYSSSNWKYAGCGAYLQSLKNSSFRTYGANNGEQLVFAKKVSDIAYSGYCTTVAAAGPTYTAQTLTFIAQDDESYYATFSSDKVTFFPIVQVIPYAITVANGKITEKSNMFESKVASTGSETISGYYIPANTGIMLYSTASNVNYYTVENYTVDDLAEGANMLMPSVAGGKFTAETGKVYYKLAYGDWTNKTQLGFYWGADNGGAFYVKAGTAYLAVPKAKAAGAKGFTLNGEATGIEGVNANVENAKAIYNLNGQRVASMAKPGLYIVNGKKVVRK